MKNDVSFLDRLGKNHFLAGAEISSYVRELPDVTKQLMTRSNLL